MRMAATLQRSLESAHAQYDLVPHPHSATSLEAAIQDADALLLLVKHSQFTNLDPLDIRSKSPARVVIDCVNGWDSDLWESAGFHVFRLGVQQ